MSRPTILPIGTILYNQDIYYNLHKRMWSVKIANGRVSGHAASFVAVAATPRVLQSGRDRVIATGRKNVHAFLRCAIVRIVDNRQYRIHANNHRMYYNPYKVNAFMDLSTMRPVTVAPVVIGYERSIVYGDCLDYYDNHYCVGVRPPSLQSESPADPESLAQAS